MNDFKVHILGCGSATPSLRHLPSCQAVEHRGRLMLVDCGEGAQLSLRRAGLNFSRITDIFISHLHGDHLLGLPGLLSTLALHDIGGEITVHIFEQGARLISELLAVVSHESSLKIKYDILDPKGGLVYEDRSMTVRSFPLRHRIHCVGFRFDEKPKPRHLNGEMARFLNIPVSQLAAVKAGADFVKADGTVVPNERLTTPADHAGSYAYCSDTMFAPSIVPHIQGVDVLYHEATYAESEAVHAEPRGHSTAAQAAEIARMANVGQLVIGHYSKRYTDSDQLLAEARAVFPNTVAADEGMVITIA